jgi:hypothetical protein
MFLFSEDKALREKMQGMLVYDQKATGDDVPRQVGVWFGQPDQEIRAQQYPYVTIDMIDISRDPAREMRGKTNAAYLESRLSESFDAETQGWETDLPIPVNIDYQITTYARQPRHDRMLVAQLMAEKLPIRAGILELDDGTVRRLDVMDVAKRDITENQKRLFVNAVTVRVSSEVVQGALTEFQKTATVNITAPIGANAGGRFGDPTFVGVETITITE